jgi:hypothetical protein
MLKRMPRITVSALKTLKGDDQVFDPLRRIHGRGNRMGARSRPSFHYSTFLSSQVEGTRLQILILEYPKRMNTRKLNNELLRLQETYSLGDIFVFQDENKTTAVSLRTFQLPRLEKIMNASSALNKNSLFKYRQLYFRVGASGGAKGKVLEAPPILKARLERAAPGFTSRPHSRFFRKLGVSIARRKEHGGENVFLVHALIDNSRA